MGLRGFFPRVGWRALITAGAAVLVSLDVGALVATGGGHDATISRSAVRPTSGTRHQTASLVLPGWRRRRDPVPILMYHVIERPRPGSRNPLLYVSRRTFAAQIRWLDRHGFQGVTLNQVEDAWTRGTPLPRRPIVISFDDGYRSQYTTAMPILRSHRWPAVLSLAVGNFDDRGDPLTATRVKKLIRAGWELASHTISHLDLREVGRRRLRHEIRDSRRILRRVFGVPVNNFSYPAGLYDGRAIAAVRAAGYRGALTVTPGLATRRHPFELHRIRVTQDLGVRGLAQQLQALGV